MMADSQRSDYGNPEDMLSFAAGPITASAAKILFERMAQACVKFLADGKDPVLVAHVWQGSKHPDGFVVELCDKHGDHTHGQTALKQVKLQVQA
jgi:hypothetical protein